MQFPRKNFTRHFLLFISFFSLLLIVSCGGGSSVSDPNANQNSAETAANSDNKKAPKDNVEELSNLIKMPETPEEAVWREEETQNPKGKKLTAVLKFTPENAGKISEISAKQQPADVQIGAEEWYPEELTAQTQLSGNESLKGTAYAANEFLNPPYTRGKLIRVQNTDYFILELTSN